VAGAPAGGAATPEGRRQAGRLAEHQRAKSILVSARGLSEEEAHQTIRRKTMSKRVPIEDMALAIVNANDLLNSAAKAP
jgi:AmiR/NasT family two-component response regulator